MRNFHSLLCNIILTPTTHFIFLSLSVMHISIMGVKIFTLLVLLGFQVLLRANFLPLISYSKLKLSYSRVGWHCKNGNMIENVIRSVVAGSCVEGRELNGWTTRVFREGGETFVSETVMVGICPYTIYQNS